MVRVIDRPDMIIAVYRKIETTKHQQKMSRTESSKSMLACLVLMECCVSSAQTQAMQISIPILPVLHRKMELC